MTDVVVLLTGGWGSDGWGVTAYGQDVTPDFAGALEADVGSVETFSDAVVGVSGLTSSGVVGSVATTGISRIELVGVEAYAQVDALRFDVLVSFAGWGRGAWGGGAWNANQTLPALSSQLGEAGVVTNVDVSVSGFSVEAFVGDVAVVEGSGVDVPLVGLQGDTELGDVNIIGGSTLSVTGLSATGEIGVVTQRTRQVVPVTGVGATAGVGEVSEVIGDANVLVTGLQGSIPTPRVLVWGKVIPDPSGTWTEIAA